MPSGNRKTITVPVEVYEKFRALHHEMRPHGSAPQWWTVNELVELHENEE